MYGGESAGQKNERRCGARSSPSGPLEYSYRDRSGDAVRSITARCGVEYIFIFCFLMSSAIAITLQSLQKCK